VLQEARVEALERVTRTAGASHLRVRERGDIVGNRLRLAGEWALAHPQAYADVYAQLTRTPGATALTITKRAALKLRFVSDADVGVLQTVADTAARDGILPHRLDVRALADTRFGAAA
jgi:sulfonate transport system substrate-binding protein